MTAPRKIHVFRSIHGPLGLHAVTQCGIKVAKNKAVIRSEWPNVPENDKCQLCDCLMHGGNLCCQLLPRSHGGS